MNHVGIDLHKKHLIVAVENDDGPVGKPKRLWRRHEDKILAHFQALAPFRAVIEASCSYRWLYDLLSPVGEVVLAHPFRLRAIVAARAKTDKLDAKLLAKLLRIDMIPQAYVPPQAYQDLRDVTRARARLSRAATQAKNQVHALLRQRNIHAPVRDVFSKAGRRWLQRLDLGMAGNLTRDELLQRLTHYGQQIETLATSMMYGPNGTPVRRQATATGSLGPARGPGANGCVQCTRAFRRVAAPTRRRTDSGRRLRPGERVTRLP